MEEEVRSGKVFVRDYNDGSGEATVHDYYKHLGGEDYDKA